jgi:hypothetical protein
VDVEFLEAVRQEHQPGGDTQQKEEEIAVPAEK